MDERAAFEAHCRDTMPDLSLDHVNRADDDDNKTWGDYIDNDTEWMWNGWQARAALASSPSQPADDYMLIRRDVVQFLRGDASLTGYWFNDDRPAHPRFWWRKYLPSLAAAPALGEGER